jgi:hypothetical protein
MRRHPITGVAGGPARAVVATAAVAALVAFGVFVGPGPAAAQFLGPEFQINTFTTGDQAFPAVSVNASGAFVVVWQSDGQDGSGLGVYAQRFDHLGNRLGSELQLNTYTAFEQSTPAAAIRGDGSFLAAWQSANQDGHGRGVFARLYGPDGHPAAPEFQVNTTTYSNQAFPNVIVNPVTQGFVISWSSAFQDGSSDAVIVRLYDAACHPLDDEITINFHSLGFQGYSRGRCDETGKFVMAYTSYELDGDAFGAAARRCGANGYPIGDELVVNNYTVSNQDYPDVAVRSDGSFVVVWHSALQDGSGYGVYQRRYGANDSPATDEILVNTHTPNSQWWPRIAMDALGGYAIAWQSDAQDGSARGVYARLYDPAGEPVTGEIQVNTNTYGDQERPAIDCDPNGNLVVVWHSRTQDGSGLGVFGRRLSARTVPSAFSRVEAEEIGGAVRVRWDVSAGMTAAGYNVYRESSGSSLAIARMLPGGAAEHIDRDVEPGESYSYTIGLVDEAGREAISAPARVTVAVSALFLFQNHPNPFNPATTIEYVLPAAGPIELGIYDARGGLVVILEEGKKPAGRHAVVWQGRDASGQVVGSGVYFCRLAAGGRVVTEKIVFLK